jgi:hypothetical protein
MAKKGVSFRFQNREEIIKHLFRILSPDSLYNLNSDPLRIYFEIRESRKKPKQDSEKQRMLKKEYQNSSKKKRRLSGTRKRIKPKIRSVKKGRTVNLKGVSY